MSTIEPGGKMIIGGLDMWGNMMATQAMQDVQIADVHGLKMDQVKEEMMMALRDEVMEYAKSTRCFKVWSHKEPDPWVIRLEEFADATHFYMHHFNVLGLSPQDAIEAARKGEEILQNTGGVFEKVSTNYLLSRTMDFLKTPSNDHRLIEQHKMILTSFAFFIAAGRLDGFTDKDIESAFYIKGRINMERLKTGY